MKGGTEASRRRRLGNGSFEASSSNNLSGVLRRRLIWGLPGCGASAGNSDGGVTASATWFTRRFTVP